MTYHYFFFAPLTLEEAQSALSQYDPELVADVFNDWFVDFCKHAGVFYRAQYEAHREIVGRLFNRETGMDVNRLFDSYDWSLWVAFSTRYGLPEHDQQSSEAVEAIENLLDAYTGHEPMLFKVGVARMFNRLDRIFENNYAPVEIRRELDALWFNRTIDNDAEKVAKLRRMPYIDYLQSRHWKRVRSALLLLTGARCQGARCVGTDSYWLGWEQDLHVHHLSYKNRGNERFGDLRMLCKDCHAAEHGGAS